MAYRRPLPVLARWLAGLEIFIGLGALAGGFGLVASPDGSALGLSTEWLRRGPFGTYLVPGLVLFFVVGGSMLTAAWAIIRRRPWAADASLAAGVILAIWMATQIAIMGLVFWLQAVYVALAVVLLLMALRFRQVWRRAAA